MISLHLADDRALARAQSTVTAQHYLHTPVDSRCSPLAYEVVLHVAHSEYRAGVLIFGRPESTRCYDGMLTYGSLKDVETGKAQYDRWEIINLARVWLNPCVQSGGKFYSPDYLPGYTDRHGHWRSTLASTVIDLALARIGYDYLRAHPPCFPDEPYQLQICLSYCDLSKHKGTIYRHTRDRNVVQRRCAAHRL